MARLIRRAEADGRRSVGQLFVAFGPAAFAADFMARRDDLLATMRAEPAPRLPSDRWLAARIRDTRDGVKADAALVARKNGLGSP